MIMMNNKVGAALWFSGLDGNRSSNRMLYHIGKFHSMTDYIIFLQPSLKS